MFVDDCALVFDGFDFYFTKS